MNFKILLQLIAIILFYIFLGNSIIFYLLSYILSMIFMIPTIVEGCKEKGCKEIIVLLYLAFLFLSYYLIIDNNPINYMILYLIPFRHICKAIAFVSVNYYLIKYYYKKKEEPLNSIENTDLLKTGDKDLLLKNTSDYNPINTQNLPSKKILIPLIILILIIIKIFRFYYDNYLFIYVNKKDWLLPNEKETKYYICADLYNNELILEDWIEQMKLLINYLGKENVYVSVIENGDSDDKTAPMLEEFSTYLNKSKIPNKIVTYPIITTDDRHRIEYLVDLRNAALAFLYQIPNLNFNKTKILFFNDIVYNYQDIVKLINTNKGDYDIACGMDYAYGFYDTWVSIDLDGKNFKHHFPQLYNKVGQDAMIDNGLIRVFSCWNGVVSMKALPFEKKTISFRTIKGYNESECTMISYDFYRAGYQKVLVNTELIFAYNYYYYYRNKFFYPWSINIFNYFAHYLRKFGPESNYQMNDYVNERYYPENRLATKFDTFDSLYDPKYENRTIAYFASKI